VRKCYHILLVVLLVAVVGGVTWQVLRPRETEPVYQGKPLSVWLEGYGPGESTPARIRKADQVVREMGTNAIPTLLRLLRVDDPPTWQADVIGLLQKQSFIKIKHVEAWGQHFRAWQAFKQLGGDAGSAVPGLMAIYERNISEDSQVETILSLGAIGPPAKSAVPMLLRGMTNASPNYRCNVMIALGQIHSEPELVVPALLKSLSDGDAQSRRWAAQTLGTLGAEATPALPALIPLLKDQDYTVRNAATNALRAIDPAAAKAGVK
jgi:hypothetical protein